MTIINWIKNNLATIYVILGRFLFRIISLNHRNLKSRLAKLGRNRVVSVSEPFSRLVFFLMSIKISTDNREGIMRTTMKQNFQELAGQKIKFYINDSSDDYFHNLNREFFQEGSAVATEFRRTQIRLPGSYYDFLTRAEQPYALTVFDDFPIIGLSPSLLHACCCLLRDFSGMVDLVLFEQMGEYNIDEERKNIVCKIRDLEVYRRNARIIGRVTYGSHEFLITENFHYGFFFSTSLVAAKDHAKRLKWYLDHISSDNPHRIELAGFLLKGPVYRYIAIPTSAFKFDLDFEHTEISIRPAVKPAKQLYDAYQQGYKLEVI